MTHFLNILSHPGSYAGAGMVMFFAGLAMVVFAIIRLAALRKADRREAQWEFNQQFVIDTGSRISDVEAGQERRRIASELGISGRDAKDN